MSQRDSVDDLIDTFGTHLQQADRRADRARRPVRLRRIALAGGGLAVAGSAAALVIGIGGGSKLDVVSQAQAALAPEGKIVHMKVAYGRLGKPDDPATFKEVREVWIAANPVRWRYDQTVAQWKYDHKGRNGHPTGRYTTDQFAYVNGTQTTYTANSNVLATTSGPKVTGWASTPPMWPGMPKGQDPVAGLRAMLVSGKLTSDGRTNLYGREVLRLHGRTDADDRQGTPSFPVEYDVDPTTFVPVRMVVTATGMGMDSNPNPAYVIWFRTFEQLPVTPQTEDLLVVHAPAGARVR